MAFDEEKKVGRPKIYDNPADLERAVVEYFTFEETDSGIVNKFITLSDLTKFGVTRKKPTISGLALYLGFADKTTLYEYRDRPEFSYPIKVAISLIEQYHEAGLSENNVTGRIFALKNMGWKDKVETGFTDNQGNDIAPVIYLPDNGRKTDNQTSTGLSGESAELPG